MKIRNGNSRKVIVSPAEIAAFNSQWPCSNLRPSRSYWFEFDTDGNLVDTDCPHTDDGSCAKALADDCRAFLFDDIAPDYAE
jgi:hypothetical protein